MKIALISRGRTNSTAIGRSLAHEKNIPYIGEQYFLVNEQLSNWLRIRPNYDKDKSFAKFYKNLEETTSRIFRNESFLTKIFPSMLHFPPSIMHENMVFEDVKKQFIFNLDVLKLNAYDQFYFLDRNLKESLYSWAYAYSTSTFHKQKNVKKRYYKIDINGTEFARAKFYIIEYFMHRKMGNYLDNRNIPYKYINELTYDQYINHNHLNTEKSNINYRDYINNINELDDFIDYWYPIIEQETSNWNFY